MSDTPPTPDKREPFLAALRDSLAEETFVKLILGKYRGDEPGLRRILIRQITVKEEPCLSMVYCYKDREVTKNVSRAQGLGSIYGMLGDPFMSAHLFLLTANVQIEYSRKGRCTLSRGKPSCNAVPSAEHDREKERMIDPAKPFLAALGVTNKEARVLPSMSRKWKQINKFLEIFQHAFESSGLAEAERVHVVDFGSGKGYLTFAVHDLLSGMENVTGEVTGIELRDTLVHFCNKAATTLEREGLSFQQGDVSSYTVGPLDIMIALHACDTATDLAIHMGIRAEAKIIMCAPCCHKQIRPQMSSPDAMAPMLQFGIHMGQEAEMVTDSVRALLLEASGYKVKMLEFVSLEHTSKNKMLLAVKDARPVDRQAILEKVATLKAFYGIREHCLETLLAAEA
ncbi:MAG: SAM-dependent methyltransferase [Verrucomicrobia bacterium]|jgi:hypothetical protein|nr:SAM-dependent methyltransferase [Verrucomicrobiota bacterium]MBT7066875.1 SAM-dependent methyltransferase [Verrucomicrobiota bacterium]MBT7699837.1 SAM-dependent methyltransferase [Verrucomicrobiota bacterium]